MQPLETGVCVYSARTNVQYARLGSVISILAQVNGPIAGPAVTKTAVAKGKKQTEKARN
jgi:hypothetical protein